MSAPEETSFLLFIALEHPGSRHGTLERGYHASLLRC